MGCGESTYAEAEEHFVKGGESIKNTGKKLEGTDGTCYGAIIIDPKIHKIYQWVFKIISGGGEFMIGMDEASMKSCDKPFTPQSSYPNYAYFNGDTTGGYIYSYNISNKDSIYGKGYAIMNHCNTNKHNMDGKLRREMFIYGYCCYAEKKTKLYTYIPDSILLLLIMYHPSILSSDIINTKSLEDQLYDVLCAKLGRNKDKFTLGRIYSSVINGLSTYSFHNLCDNSKFPTLILCRSLQYNKVFGGFTSVSCNPEGSAWTDKYDPFSFFFFF